MNVAPVSIGAKEVAWVRPAPAALLALTSEAPPSETEWQLLLLDPALLAHLLRFSRPSLQPTAEVLSPSLLLQPSLALQAASFLTQQPPSGPLPDPVQKTLALAAQYAQQLGPPELATWATALTQLPALGWLALQQTEHPLADSPLEITVQLLTRWRVPNWVSATIAGLLLLPADAERLGAPRKLFEIVQIALASAEHHAGKLGLTNQNAQISADLTAPSTPLKTLSSWPIADELLIRLLRQTAQARRSSSALWLHEAEQREQKLLRALAQARTEFEHQVQEARLSGLAEFAAGASHEINNPLAVISGHAQLLMNGEADPDRQRQLQIIIRQTRRIDELLKGTRQFARPSRPKPIRFALDSWPAELLQVFQLEIEQKQIQWHCDWLTEVYAFGDPAQLRQALTHVVRNAIEAAPARGEVGLRLENDGERLLLLVTDSGPGPLPEQESLMFDPFFSGRSAGRGRGLGLSIAWRLLTINGGTIQWLKSSIGPTTFSLEFPASTVQTSPMPQLERRSA